MNDPAAPAPAASDAPQPSANTRRFRGRLVVLLALVAVPLLAIPLLLTGPGMQRQVCLVTLAQRERTGWQIGYMELGSPEWRTVDEWPRAVERMGLPGELLAPPAESPLERARTIWGEDLAPVHYWTTSARSMPFAFVVRIENSRAINPRHADVMAVQQLAHALLDAHDAEDAACARALADALLEGQELAETDEGRIFSPSRRLRDPIAREGEKRARDLFNPLAAAAGEGEGAREALRAVLCEVASP